MLLTYTVHIRDCLTTFSHPIFFHFLGDIRNIIVSNVKCRDSPKIINLHLFSDAFLCVLISSGESVSSHVVFIAGVNDIKCRLQRESMSSHVVFIAGVNESTCRLQQGDIEFTCRLQRGVNESTCRLYCGDNEFTCRLQRGVHQFTCCLQQGVIDFSVHID